MSEDLFKTVLFKKYRLVRSENLDEFFQQRGKSWVKGCLPIINYITIFLGVSYLIRKIACNTTSTVQLVKEGENSYSFNTSSTFRKQALKFNLNEEFLEDTMDGRKIKCLITFEGNKMIQQQTGEKSIRVERVFTETEMITTCFADEVVATRWFEAIE